MVRSRDVALPNVNRSWAVEVLAAVKDLRQAYKESSQDIIDQRLRELRSLLRDDRSQAALDNELRTRKLVPVESGKDLIEREAALGDAFGYSPREVKRYIRRARATQEAGYTGPEIANTLQLTGYLQETHAATILAITQNVGGLKGRREVRRARSRAQDRLFVVGVLVADAVRRSLFDFSYSLAVMALAEEAI
ncbi:MAG: hypothetical protein ACJ74U_06145 [Jatrophihabitantaceae bacterium]